MVGRTRRSSIPDAPSQSEARTNVCRNRENAYGQNVGAKTRDAILSHLGLFDRVAQAPHSEAPPVLFHYTSWESAQGILANQRFWATAHDCTNDKAELVSADRLIIEVAKDLQKNGTGVATEVLRLFVNGYAKLQVTRMISVCLACFSVARDDEQQWRKYGDEGRGVCLGIRLLNEPGVEEPPSALVKVDYSESSWRSDLSKNFGSVYALLARAEASRRNYELALSALHQIARSHPLGRSEQNGLSSESSAT